MKQVVIVSARRTAIGTFGGSLKDLNGAVLAGAVIKEAVHRAGVDSILFDDYVLAVAWNTTMPSILHEWLPCSQVFSIRYRHD